MSDRTMAALVEEYETARAQKLASFYNKLAAKR